MAGHEGDFETLHPFKGPSSLYSSAEVGCLCHRPSGAPAEQPQQGGVDAPCGDSPPSWPRLRLGSYEQRCAIQVHPKPRVE